MKKIIALFVVCVCSYSFATEDYSEPMEIISSYDHIWRDIMVRDYGMALYSLKNISPISEEDEIHQNLIKLFIAMRRHEKKTAHDLLDKIDVRISNIYGEQYE